MTGLDTDVVRRALAAGEDPGRWAPILLAEVDRLRRQLADERAQVGAASADADVLIREIRAGHDHILSAGGLGLIPSADPAAGIGEPAARSARGSASGPRTPGRPQADDPAGWSRLVWPAPLIDPALLREDFPSC